MMTYLLGVTPGTKSAHHGIFTNMVAKITIAMQELEHCAAGDNFDFYNSQDVLDYIVEI